MLMLAVLVVGLLLTLGAGRLGGALVGRARAESAADAAALAAADRLALGGGRRRGRRTRTAASNHAQLVSCDCAGTSAAVVVELDLGVFGSRAGRARAEVDPRCVLDRPGC